MRVSGQQPGVTPALRACRAVSERAQRELEGWAAGVYEESKKTVEAYQLTRAE